VAEDDALGEDVRDDLDRSGASAVTKTSPDRSTRSSAFASTVRLISSVSGAARGRTVSGVKVARNSASSAGVRSKSTTAP